MTSAQRGESRPVVLTYRRHQLDVETTDGKKFCPHKPSIRQRARIAFQVSFDLCRRGTIPSVDSARATDVGEPGGGGIRLAGTLPATIARKGKDRQRPVNNALDSWRALVQSEPSVAIGPSPAPLGRPSKGGREPGLTATINRAKSIGQSTQA